MNQPIIKMLSTLSEKVIRYKKWIAISLLALLLIPITLFVLVYAGFFGKLYSKEELKKIESYMASEVYSQDHKVLGKFYWENRSPVSYQNLPPLFIQSLIATEDARFYEHNGVDAIGLVRVFFKTLLLGDKKSGGGSTIAQQLAKNIFKRKNKYGIFSLLINKIKEAIYAVRFNSVYSQEEILAMYLNTVSFGEDTYGIKNACQRFFNKEPDSLKIEEGALLVGMLSNPTLYNPRTKPDRALARRNNVLDNLADHDYITQTHCDSLKAIPIQLNYHNGGMYGTIAPYFLVQIEEMTHSILEKITKEDGEKYNLYTDGLKIYTPLHYQMQEYANAAVEKHMQALQETFNQYWRKSNPWGRRSSLIYNELKKSKRYKSLVAEGKSEEEIKKIVETPIEMEVFDWKGDKTVTLSPLDSIKYYMRFLHSGFLAIEPSTGEIRTWVGGNHYNYFQYDHVTSTRQVGSTFKPIVYATALEQGVSPCEYFKNEQHVYEQYENWAPKNSNGEYKGKYSMKGALANSVNVVSVEVLFKAGIDNVLRTARNMGIKSNIPNVPAIALGVADISLLEMVLAYCNFANGGKKVKPIYISRIEDKNGKIIYQADKPKPIRTISKQTAYYMTEMLKAVVNEGTASRLRGTYGIAGEIAGKTGTTQSQADGWFIGYTPKIVAGAWVGADNPHIHFNSTYYGQGAAMALPIWAYFMQGCKSNAQSKALVNGSFYWGNEVNPMPECESFIEDTVLDNLLNIFKPDPIKRLERKEKREKRRAERRAKRSMK
jgi:penicillin-binding protein 1A